MALKSWDVTFAPVTDFQPPKEGGWRQMGDLGVAYVKFWFYTNVLPKWADSLMKEGTSD